MLDERVPMRGGKKWGWPRERVSDELSCHIRTRHFGHVRVPERIEGGPPREERAAGGKVHSRVRPSSAAFWACSFCDELLRWSECSSVMVFTFGGGTLYLTSILEEDAWK